MLKNIEAQTNGLIKEAHFSGGGAESPYCSFHASYLKGCCSLKALPKREGACCCQSSDTRDTVAQQWSGKASGCCCDAENPTNALDAFLQKTVESTFTVSGMVFQDAWNLDLERLQRCYICEVDSTYGMVPFCAYNLTNSEGKALYRK